MSFLIYCFIIKIYDMACGYGFTVVAASARDTDHRLFASGLNTDSQIGYHRDPQSGEPLDRLARPAPIHLPLNKPQERVSHVACGRAHTIILTNEQRCNYKLYFDCNLLC